MSQNDLCGKEPSDKRGAELLIERLINSNVYQRSLVERIFSLKIRILGNYDSVKVEDEELPLVREMGYFPTISLILDKVEENNRRLEFLISELEKQI